MDAGTETLTDQGAASPDGPVKPADADFVYEVDGVTYHYDRPVITGAQIMVAASIPSTEGLVQLLPDGTTATIQPGDEVQLVPGSQFKRRPRFKRG
jgi:hypothetical protein